MHNDRPYLTRTLETNYRALALAVIERALFDAACQDNPIQAAEAQDWLYSGDAALWLDAAGVDASYFYNRLAASHSPTEAQEAEKVLI
jgi:hypothetical protein